MQSNDIKKVAIFCDFFSSLGGTEYYNYMLAKSLIKRGIEVKIFIGEKPKLTYWLELFDQENISYYFPNEFHTDLTQRKIENKFIKNIKDDITKWNPDIIHSHPAGKLLISWIENDSSQLIPLVATEWTTPSKNTAHWYQSDLSKFVNRIDAFIATCKKSKIGIKEFHGYNGEIFVVPHLLQFPSHIPKIKSEDLYSVGCVSRLSAEKGLVFLIGAFKKINSEFPNATLHIYGHGKDEECLKDLIDALGLKDCVFLEGVFKPIDGINEIAEKHTIFVQPSLFESIPTSIIELMGRKRVIVATDVGGISEIINKKMQSGLLIQPASTESIYKALKNLFQSKEKVQLYSDNALHIFSEKYTLENNINKLLEIYSKLKIKNNLISSKKDIRKGN